MYNDKVYVSTRNCSVIALNLTDGSVHKAWKNENESRAFLDFSSMRMIGSRIVGISYFMYWEIDLETEVLQRYDVAEELKQYVCRYILSPDLSLGEAI